MLFFALALLFSVISFNGIEASKAAAQQSRTELQPAAATQPKQNQNEYGVGENDLKGFIKNRIKEQFSNIKPEQEQELKEIIKAVYNNISNKSTATLPNLYKISDKGNKIYNNDLVTQLILSNIVSHITDFKMFSILNSWGITLDKKTNEIVKDILRAKIVEAIEKKKLEKFIGENLKKPVKTAIINYVQTK